MTDDCLAELVIAAFVAFDDVHHKLHHVALQDSILLLHRVDLLHAALNHLHDVLAGVAIDQDDPLVDQELLCLELNLDCLQHLDRLDDDRERLLRHGCIVLLEKKEVELE